MRHPIAFSPLSRAAAALCTLSVAACGGQSLTRTGFLDNYDQMSPQPNHEDDAIYVKPGFSAANYSKVIIEPVEWVPSPKSPDREPETRATLQGNFHDALTKSLSERFTVVPDPGPGRDPGPRVLRVRSAITNTRRALWWVNVPAQAAQIAVGSVGLLRPSAGGASEEIEVRDASTNQPIVAIATYNIRTKRHPIRRADMREDRHLLVYATLLAAFAMSATPNASAQPVQAVGSDNPLQVTVGNIRKAAGHIRVAVCTRDTFLKEGCPFHGTAPALPGSVTVTIHGVTPGTYAIQVFQDEDDSGRIKRSLLGLPEEGFGFSRDAPANFGSPSFTSAAIQMPNGPGQVGLKLRYLD